MFFLMKNNQVNLNGCFWTKQKYKISTQLDTWTLLVICKYINSISSNYAIYKYLIKWLIKFLTSVILQFDIYIYFITLYIYVRSLINIHRMTVSIYYTIKHDTYSFKVVCNESLVKSYVSKIAIQYLTRFSETFIFTISSFVRCMSYHRKLFENNIGWTYAKICAVYLSHQWI